MNDFSKSIISCSISASPQDGDIEDQGTFYDPQNQIKTDNNYLYTAIGELQVDKSEDIEEIVWRVDSKIAEVRRTNNSTKKNLRFDYDAMGNRIAKHIYADNQFTDWKKSTYYVRDASGNVMAVYDREATGQEPPSSFRVSERHIYGSSRIGMDVTTYEFISTTYTATYESTRELGHKQYEISNHLGNVLSVITDQKLPEEAAEVIVSYSAVIITATDYSPFGVGLYGRSWSEGYRYGFNGQERQKEVASSGQNYSAEFWMYSSALAFRWEIDPKGDPSYSPYNCFKSNPILYADPFGDTVKYGGLGDRINTLLARTFNKGFRSDFKKWKKDEAVFTIDKSSEFGERGLVDAVPCHINCLNEGSSSEHDQFAVYYNKGFRVGDISNKGVKVAVGFMRMPFELGWKIGIKLPVSLTLGPLVVGIRKLFNPNLDVGWGAADRLQLPWDPGNNARGWLSWGFGDYNDFNSIGQRQRNVRIGPSDALTGIRVGGGKKMPIQFIEFGQSMRFEAGGWGYHFRINIWRDGMKGPGSGNAKNDDNIDFRSR